MPCRSLSRTLIALSAAPFIIAVFASFSRAESHCPESCISGVCWTSAVRDTVLPPGSGGGYDLIQGYVDAWGCGGGGINVVARDEFVVLGASPGTLLVFEARLTFSGYGAPLGHDRGAVFQAGISSGTESRETGTIWENLSGTLTVPIVKLPGEEFLVSYSVSAGGSYGDCGSASGTLDFVGLAPGTSVVSCQGFRQDLPVPALAESWGRVKARYR